MDFFSISEKQVVKYAYPCVKITPSFESYNVKDIIVKGGEFYAFYDEENAIWSTNRDRLLYTLDSKLKEVYSKYIGADVRLLNDVNTDLFRSYTGSGSYIEIFHKFCKTANNLNDHDLDTKVVFLNTEQSKDNYSTGPLDYICEEGPIDNWDYLIGTLYNPDERTKIEWMIGSVIAGYSTVMQKFFVFYGPPGSGKSTVLDIIQAMFYKYYKPFNAKRVVSNSEFALDSLAGNPLLAIQHDGDLSKIVDNSLLNSIVAHEPMIMNEKQKKPYPFTSKAVLLLGTNSPVKITDSKSGVKRRLIDIQPSGRKVPTNKFDRVKSSIIKYERGSVAYHCLQVFNELGPKYYNEYEPVDMYYKTDPFFNFIEENYDLFCKNDYTTLNQIKKLYKDYADDNNISHRFQLMELREYLEDYFREHIDNGYVENADGTRTHMRHIFKGFKKEKFDRYQLKHNFTEKDETDETESTWLSFECCSGRDVSNLDNFLGNCQAQYATDAGIPSCKWENCTTELSDLDTSRLHYVKVPENLIVIDFDIKNENGEKDYNLNLAAASKWPATYAELSKSGAGIHLHYLYSGDVSILNRIYDDDIEIKVFTGNASLRRQLTRFNDKEIVSISDGLPFKEKKGKKMYKEEYVTTEKSLEKVIIGCLRKEYHGSTTPNVHLIKHVLDEAYENGVKYNLMHMRQDVLNFAMNSSHQPEHCVELVTQMHFMSKEFENIDSFEDDLNQHGEPEDFKKSVEEDEEKPIMFYDLEILPNLFLFGGKVIGKEPHVIFNPSPEQIEKIVKNYRLIGFNNRKYDNYLMHARMKGANEYNCYLLSKRIISENDKYKKREKSDNAVPFWDAYYISYTDIYDYSKKKQSLKKWEVELGIPHDEFEWDWDSPLPEDKWQECANYNINDLNATEAVWYATQTDFTTRKILADISGGTVNDSDNSLTAKLIFGDKKPTNYLHYRNLAEPVFEMEDDMREFLEEAYPEMMAQRHGEAGSLLPYFPGYTFDPTKPNDEKSYYKGEYVGEGGLVRAKKGVYGYSKTFDVTSEHPNSACAEYLFGEFTRVYWQLKEARKHIKHKEFDILENMFDGKLMKYLGDKSEAKKLSTTLKTPINSIYGLTKARTPNKFRDDRNIDNIVAKRGALFMVDLKEAVENLGYNVFHVKTDSLKIVNPDDFIEKYVMDFGKRYGYEFDVEHIFEKICLSTDADYIAKLDVHDKEWIEACEEAKEKGKPEPTRWTATGATFAFPYVFKTLFSHEEITFDDLCLTVNSKEPMYLDFNENTEDVSFYERVAKIRKTIAEGQIDKLNKKEKAIYDETSDISDDELNELIGKGHNFTFIGKVGKFCPVIAGCGGAELVKKVKDKYNYVAESKGRMFMEADYVKKNELFDLIDYGFFNEKVNSAVKTIEQYSTDFIEREEN